MLRSWIVFPLVLFLGALHVQAQGCQELRPVKRSSSRHVVQARTERFTLGASVGLLPTFWSGGVQDAPALQATAQVFLNPRLRLGLAYGSSATTSDAYTDFENVQSWQSTRTTHLGARLSGTIVRRGPFEMYGGLQLGVNVAKSSQRHEFPVGFEAGVRDAYIADRPNPFGPSGSQLSISGHFGASLEVLPHGYVFVEAGNNLSLLSAGLELRL